MNDLFVNVKVDREERPDVDEIYMEAVQAMTGNGGWPMTVFLTPDGRPFFGGTYFPQDARGGMISFPDLCRRIDYLWRTRRDDVEAQAGQLTDALGRTALLDPGEEVPGVDALAGALQRPRPAARRHLRRVRRRPQVPAGHEPGRARAGPGGAARRRRASAPTSIAAAVRQVVETSLDAMASGGIYDHLGGGFARYSVDQAWLVPHFEKMLYDQALLTRVYLHAWQVTGLDRYRQVLDETVGYVLRDLRHPDGGFFSAEDADSEGEEGLFYVWTPDQVVAALDGDDDLADEVMAFYGVSPGGNFEGRTILNRLAHRGDIDRPTRDRGRRAGGCSPPASERVRPGLDDKVLTEWNGAHARRPWPRRRRPPGRDDWRTAAVANGEFLLRELRRDDGRWLRSWQADGGATRSDGRSGRARHLAYAADHAALVDAFARLAEATGEARWIDAARTTADALLDLFWDAERGGVFTTGSDAERLIARNKDLMDNATPGANSLAAVGLCAWPPSPASTATATTPTRSCSSPGPWRRGTRPRSATCSWRSTSPPTVSTRWSWRATGPTSCVRCQRTFLPRAVLAWGERYDSPLWEGRDDGAAYVCRDYACGLPADDPHVLAAQLAGAS